MQLANNRLNVRRPAGSLGCAVHQLG